MGIVKLLLETGKAEVTGRRGSPEFANITINLQKLKDMEHAEHKLTQEDILSDDGRHRDDDDLVPSSNVESFVYIAARYGSLEILNALLAAGANPNIKSGVDCTAIKAACRRAM